VDALGVGQLLRFEILNQFVIVIEEQFVLQDRVVYDVNEGTRRPY
jgi:hypothetical protein